MQNFSHLAARVLNTPLLLEPQYAQVFFSALAKRLDIIELRDESGRIETGQKLKVEAHSFKSGNKIWDTEGLAPYQVVKGVAVLPIGGTLVHKNGYLNTFSGMTGYDGIVARAHHAASNSQVKGILLDFDTPGGEVAGCFDAARMLRKIADQCGKPLWSACFDMNCSAGMALASPADRRLITETGIAGSIGVLMAHHSYEQYLEDAGIKITLIHSGAHKVDGNPYENLSTEVLDKFTAETDELRIKFASLVAELIPGLDLQDVLSTEAACFTGQLAVDVGLADEVVNGNDAVDIFVEHLGQPGKLLSIAGDASMKKVGNSKADAGAQAPVAESVEENKVEANSEVDSNVGPGESASESVVTEQVEAPDANAEEAQAESGTKAERARVQSILQSEEADGRAEMANHLAFDTDLTAEAAIALLAKAPKTQKAFALAEAMSTTKQPNLEGDQGAELSDTEKQVASVMSSYNRAKGISQAG